MSNRRVYVEKFISGKWSFEDTLGAVLDETSTAASAGSGTSKPLGSTIAPGPTAVKDEEQDMPANDQKIEKLVKEYYVYHTRSGGSLEEFIERVAPGAPLSLLKRVRGKIGGKRI